MREDNKIMLTARVDPELFAELDRVAEAEGTNRTQLIERLLAKGLKSEREFLAALDSNIYGPVMKALSHPVVMDTVVRQVLETIGGGELDDQRVRVARQRSRPKTKVRGKEATS